MKAQQIITDSSAKCGTISEVCTRHTEMKTAFRTDSDLRNVANIFKEKPDMRREIRQISHN